jgi:hypothetical protein
VLRRAKFRPFVALLLLGSALGACGGGGHSYKAGTPAVTGVAPTDCALVPLDFTAKTLGLNLTGPAVGHRPDGVSCTFNHAKGGGNAVELVQISGNVTSESFNVLKTGLKSANNTVKKIGGWGDEAYAATVYFVAVENNFAVRKGKVSVVIQSTADYKNVKNLMKDVLSKL